MLTQCRDMEEERMKKYKGVVTAADSFSLSPKSNSNRSNNSGSDGEDSQDNKSITFSLSHIKFNCRKSVSRYDFVKVKVWLGDNADHYYVFSRFLLSRMLTVTKIPNHVAIKIALELKKLLIDNSLLDVSQSDLETNVFKLMERRGYGEEYISRYRMMTRSAKFQSEQFSDFSGLMADAFPFELLDNNLLKFTPSLVVCCVEFHHQRVPLVILVCGTACVGKSTIATQLAQRLNLPNVLQTDMVYELLRTSTDAPLSSSPVWARNFSSSEELITEFVRECRIVRKGLAGDLKKAMKDGKPIIIEGIHLDPSIYLMHEEGKAPATPTEKANSESVASGDNAVRQLESNSASVCGSSGENSNNCPEQPSTGGTISSEQVNNVTDSLESTGLTGTVSENKVAHAGETLKDPDVDRNPSVKKEKSGPDPIIIPIVLKMADFDHKALLEEWLLTRTFSDKCLVQNKDELITKLKTIQNYLCSFTSQGPTVVNVSATTFPQTLDWLHGHLLQCIEQGISSVSNANDKKLAEN